MNMTLNVKYRHDNWKTDRGMENDNCHATVAQNAI